MMACSLPRRELLSRREYELVSLKADLDTVRARYMWIGVSLSCIVMLCC